MPAVGEHHGTGGHPAGVPAALDYRRAGFKCCRWCDKSTARKTDKTIMFRAIPADSVFFGAGAYWRGPDSNGDVLGSGHANSRLLCDEHDKVRQTQERRWRRRRCTPHRCSCPPTSFVGCVLASWSTRTTGWKPSRWLQCAAVSCAVTVQASSSLRRCSME